MFIFIVLEMSAAGKEPITEQISKVDLNSRLINHRIKILMINLPVKRARFIWKFSANQDVELREPEQ